MTLTTIVQGVLAKVAAAPRTDHELISFAVFLDYRARRLRALGGEEPAADSPAKSVLDVALLS